MKFLNAIKANIAILCVAFQKNKSFTQVRQEMQQALDHAWDIAWMPGNIYAQVKWQKLFRGARKPTLEEFIARLATETISKMRPKIN